MDARKKSKNEKSHHRKSKARKDSTGNGDNPTRIRNKTIEKCQHAGLCWQWLSRFVCLMHRPPIKITDKISAPNRPDNLIITIQLPKLQNSKNIKLDVQDRSLTLKTENEEPSYSLKVELPYQIDSSNGANAKYKKEQVHSKFWVCQGTYGARECIL